MLDLALFPDSPDDIKIIEGQAPAFLDSAKGQGVLWQASPGCFMLEVPNVARYLVEDGRKITFERLSAGDDAAVARFLGWTPLSALWFQRGLLAFHAAAAERDGKGLILAGDSGSGKSTLIAELVRRGWRLLADELTLVETGKTGELQILPTSNNILLWPVALEHIEIPEHQQTAGDLNRRGWQPDNTGGQSCPVSSMVILSVHNFDTTELEPVTGGKRFQMLGSLLYNSHIADILLDRMAFLTLGSKIAQNPWFRLRRPRGVWNLASLADQLEGVVTSDT